MKNTIVYILGEVFNKLAPFLFLPYITQTLGAEDYGRLAYIQTVAVLISIPLGLSQQAYVRKIKFSSSDIELSELLFTIILHNIFSALFVLCTLYFFVDDTIYILGIAFLQVMISTMLTLIQCAELPKKYIKSQITYTALTLLLTFIFLEQTQTYLSRLNAIITSGAISCVLMVFTVRKYVILEEIKTIALNRFFCIYKGFLSFGFLLLFSQVSFYIRSQFERYVIQYRYNPEELGVYMLAFQVSSISLLISNAILLAMQPRVLGYLKDNSINVRVIHGVRLSLFYPVIFLFFTSIFSYYLSPEIVTYVFGREFEDLLKFLPQMVMAFAFMLPIGLCTEILVYYGRNKLISNVSILSTIIYIPIVMILSKFSLYMIPYGILISNAIQAFILLYCVKKEGRCS